ncbi:hypothetical protein HPB51_008436 [Rhipicephalus microplus]|uniref:Procollagen-lysine 2-oxoglutarate 5-dioxygenase n=1 Tax=Rhipicephalus microplus TaxID=6941 RepID=A0A9J6EG16_RHIMP|nr:hypothetical protein HPB51_008436 [Rhipicephalus microplus]
MKYLSLVFLGYWLSLLSSVGVVNSSAKGEGDKLEPPTVLIAVILRNKAHVLPYFFGYLEQQSYPKSRISLWIYTDHNVDQTAEIVDTWAEAVLNKYHNVNFTSEDGEAFFPDEEGSQKWTAQRYWHVIRLREEAIQVARTLWADFIFFLDGDAMLSNPKTIQDLVEENRTIIAPMLDSRSAYSNFWCGMNEKGYYERTDEYMPILEREKVGVFPVVMVHSATLINLNHAHSRKLTYDPQKLEGYMGPNDDVITFAHSAKFAAVEMFISNKDQYGHILAPTESPANEAEELLNLKLDVTGAKAARKVPGVPAGTGPTPENYVCVPASIMQHPCTPVGMPVLMGAIFSCLLSKDKVDLARKLIKALSNFRYADLHISVGVQKCQANCAFLRHCGTVPAQGGLEEVVEHVLQGSHKDADVRIPLVLCRRDRVSSGQLHFGGRGC